MIQGKLFFFFLLGSILLIILFYFLSLLLNITSMFAQDRRRGGSLTSLIDILNVDVFYLSFFFFVSPLPFLKFVGWLSVL